MALECPNCEVQVDHRTKVCPSCGERPSIVHGAAGGAIVPAWAGPVPYPLPGWPEEWAGYTRCVWEGSEPCRIPGSMHVGTPRSHPEILNARYQPRLCEWHSRCLTMPRVASEFSEFEKWVKDLETSKYCCIWTHQAPVVLWSMVMPTHRLRGGEDRKIRPCRASSCPFQELEGPHGRGAMTQHEGKAAAELARAVTMGQVSAGDGLQHLAHSVLKSPFHSAKQTFLPDYDTMGTDLNPGESGQ